MTVLDAATKLRIKVEAKDLKINIVGKSIDTLLDLIDSKTGRTRELTMKLMMGEKPTEEDIDELINGKPDASLQQVRAIAKELQIPFTKTTPRADLVFAIADLKGWANEKAEVIEFLLLGGEINEVPGFTGIAPKKPLNNRETSAGGKVEPEVKKTPRKVTKKNALENFLDGAKESRKPAKPEADGVTLASILKEMDVDGRVARRKLRGSDIAKPGDSWAWPTGHVDIDRVRKLLAK